MNPWKLIGYALLGLLAIGGVFAWNRHTDSQLAAETAKWQAKTTLDKQNAQVAVDSAYQAGLANAQSVPVYLAGKDRIIHDAAGNPQAAAAVKACFAAADTRISACEKARQADSVVIAKKDSVIKDLENKPEPQIPRFQPFGEALYDVAHRVPVIRAGATARIIGPVSLSVAGEYAAPPAGQSSPAFRAVAGLRVAF